MKQVLLILVSLISIQSFANQPAFFAAALSVPEVAKLLMIDSVEVIETMKCPGCFTFLIKGQRPGFTSGSLRQGEVYVQTELDLQTHEVRAKATASSK